MDEIEIRQPGFLGVGNGLNGLIGGKDNGHLRGGFLFLRHALDGLILADDLACRSRGRKREVVGRDVALVVVDLGGAFADAGIRTDGEAVNRAGGFSGSFAQRLREQRERRDEKENVTIGRKFLGDFQRGEGFASAARHDEFASVGGFEVADNFGDGNGLVFEGFLLRQNREVLRAFRAELGPVNRAGVEIVNREAVDRLGLVFDGVVGVFAPAVGGGNNEAGREQRISQRGEIGINVLLGNRVLGEEKFALDAAEFAGGAFLRHKVNADIADVPLLRPFIEQPDAGEALGVDGIEFEITAEQPLEAVAEIAVGRCGLAKLREDAVDGMFGPAPTMPPLGGA